MVIRISASIANGEWSEVVRTIIFAPFFLYSRAFSNADAYDEYFIRKSVDIYQY